MAIGEGVSGALAQLLLAERVLLREDVLTEGLRRSSLPVAVALKRLVTDREVFALLFT